MAHCLTTLPLALLAASVATASPAQSEYDNPHEIERIGEVEQIYSGDPEPDLAVSTFRNIHRLFPTATVTAGGEARELPTSERKLAPIEAEIDGNIYDLDDFLALSQVTGMLVLKGRGNGPRDLPAGQHARNPLDVDVGGEIDHLDPRRYGLE